MRRTEQGGDSPDSSGATGVEVVSEEQASGTVGEKSGARAERSNGFAASVTPDIRPALEALAVVIAPTTLLTALLYYFGWAYTFAQADYFGVDSSIYRYSTQEYLLRSIDAIIVPFGGVLLLGVVFLWLHWTLSRWIHFGRNLRMMAVATRVMLAVGTVLFLAGAAAVAEIVRAPEIIPLSLGFGTAGITYGVYLRNRIRARSGAEPSTPRWLTAISLTLISMVLVLCMFWGFGDWAYSRGVERSKELTVNDLPNAVVYSKQDLHVEGPGVDARRVGDEQSAYAFRYTGLKLYIYTNGRYFLFPTGWTKSLGEMVILPESDSLRLEFAPPRD